MQRPRLSIRVLLAALAGVLVALAPLAAWLMVRGDSPSDVAAEGEPTLAFAEFGPQVDHVYIAPASDPARRRLVAAVDHLEGWGINPAFSTSGSRAAYTVLAPGSRPQRDAPAELWLLDLRSGERTRLAHDADLLAQPGFDTTGEHLVYRAARQDGGQEIVSVDLASKLRTVVHTYEGPFGVFPIGFDRGGAVLFASLSPGGTDIYRVRRGAPPEAVVHASDQVARDWRVSPDGKELSYLAPELLAERYIYRLNVVSLADGAARTLDATAAARAEQFGPVWRPEGGGVTVGREAYPDASASALTISLEGGDGGNRALAGPVAGFDVPLGWSPNGEYLVARSFDGATSYQPGRASVVVISAAGQRWAVATASELIFLGWVGSG